MNPDIKLNDHAVRPGPFVQICLLSLLIAGPLSAQTGSISEQIDSLKTKWGDEYIKPINVPVEAISISEHSWWGRHYVNGLGLSLFDDDIVAIPKLKAEQPDEVRGTTLGNSDFGEIKGDDVYYPFADMMPARRLGNGKATDLFSDSNPHHQHLRPVVLLRFQDDLSSKPADAQPATVIWENDRASNSQQTMLNAALMLDLYWCGYTPNGYGGHSRDAQFHVLLGAEAERYDSGLSTADIDIRRYSALAEFSPGVMLEKLLRRRIAPFGYDIPRQTMSIGWLHEDNQITDAQRDSIQIKYAPSFKLWGQNLIIGERSYFKKLFRRFIGENEWRSASGAVLQNLINSKQSAPQADKADGSTLSGSASQSGPGSADGIQNKNLDHFFYLRPKFGIDFGQTSLSSVLQTQQIPNMNLLYSVETGLSFARETYHIGYRLAGLAGIDKGGNQMMHEAFFHVTPHGFPARLFATYKKGKLAPDFSQVDVFQVGVGFKF